MVVFLDNTSRRLVTECVHMQLVRDRFTVFFFGNLVVNSAAGVESPRLSSFVLLYHVCRLLRPPLPL